MEELKEVKKVGEDNSIKLFKDKFPDAVKATHKQDTEEHWDFIVNGKKIELKAHKSYAGRDYPPEYHRVTVEGVNNFGKESWVFGEADIICMLMDEEFILVDRPKLEKYVRRVFPPTNQVVYQKHIKNTWYQRKHIHGKHYPHDTFGWINLVDMKDMIIDRIPVSYTSIGIKLVTEFTKK